jgi:DnaJ like chaperone protein
MFTLVGVILGIIYGGFWGAVLGFIIGSFLDSVVFRKKVNVKKHFYSQNDFSRIILILTAAVMKSDTELKTSELDYVKEYLKQNFSPQTAQSLLLQLREILKQDYQIDPVCGEIRMNASVSEKLYILQFLFGLAGADGNYSTAEVMTIQHISDLIGISRGDFESIKTMYMGWSRGGAYTYSGSYSTTSSAPIYDLDNDYRILEIPSTATNDEVKSNYRMLAKKYHPDKVNHLGEDIRKAAEVKFTKLNQAYERIKKSRGMN